MKKEYQKYCIRCGQFEKEVRKMGAGECCNSWGKSYGNHSYELGIEEKGKDGHCYIKPKNNYE